MITVKKKYYHVHHRPLLKKWKIQFLIDSIPKKNVLNLVDRPIDRSNLINGFHLIKPFRKKNRNKINIPVSIAY